MSSGTTLPFPEVEPGYLDPYIYTPAPQPVSYTGPGPRRNPSSGSRSLAPSDSASNFVPDEAEEARFELVGPAGLGRQKSTLRGVQEGQVSSFPEHYMDQGMMPRAGPTYSPGPYPFGAQAVRPVSSAALSYVDEEGGYHRSDRQRPGSNSGRTFRSGQNQEGEEGESLVDGAVHPAGSPFAESECTCRAFLCSKSIDRVVESSSRAQAEPNFVVVPTFCRFEG